MGTGRALCQVKLSQSQKDKYCDSALYVKSKMVKPIETESGIVVARVWGRNEGLQFEITHLQVRKMNEF